MAELPEADISEVLARVIGRADLTQDESTAVMAAVMSGKLSDPQIAGLLVSLQAKGITGDEIAGFVAAMLDAAVRVRVDQTIAERLVDVVGTGGDGAQTFNISTLAAVVVAATGQPVAKHGNRAASGLCGSADLLEAWGVAIDLGPSQVATSIEEVGIGFLFARTYHPAMRIVGPVRQQLGIPTVFNILGPLSNPADVPYQAVGVASKDLAPVMAHALAQLGKRRALVFRGQDGLDELTTTGPSDLWQVDAGAVSERAFDPEEVGIARTNPDSLRGGDIAANVAIADEILAGASGPKSDIVVLNAGAALLVSGRVDSLASGVELARDALQSGAALRTKQDWIQVSQRLAVSSGS